MAKKGYVGRLTNKLVAYAFTTGVILALVLGLVAGLLPAGWLPWLTSLLILAGLVVGFFNISSSEQKDYVLYVTALVVVISLSKNILGAVNLIGPYLDSVLTTVMAFVVPSVLVAGLKAVVGLARY
ncbi:MAG: hypothetical protein KKA62_03270 [Nanoarchaeota archaeon]|nr:hypothetical protein [Nanoarchaeota archaeon]MBU1644341.1 hypothetical protein [Nanoarchaeota archaeon]MBU1976946.1 hypothetical protein [Nanoarchaeota archaeon]